MDINVKKEFLKHIKDRKVKCVKIHSEDWGGIESNHRYLKIGYSQKDYGLFLKEINFQYDNGYGGQEMHGIIWYENGNYSERGEYDGSEWWEYKECPEIPEELNQTQKESEQ